MNIIIIIIIIIIIVIIIRYASKACRQEAGWLSLERVWPVVRCPRTHDRQDSWLRLQVIIILIIIIIITIIPCSGPIPAA
jgi:hypothetical protein